MTAVRLILEGSRCTSCGTAAFPTAEMCQKCRQTSMETIDLGTRGTVWAYTVQRFAPKSPPYVPPADGFRPFAVGYVELPAGIKVEAVLDCTDFTELEGNAEVVLVDTVPVPRFATASALNGARS
ncbi:Zn-ribbon domain-containing OB-fold protein [Mycolicibacterium thermoresistibile]